MWKRYPTYYATFNKWDTYNLHKRQNTEFDFFQSLLKLTDPMGLYLLEQAERKYDDLVKDIVHHDENSLTCYAEDSFPVRSLLGKYSWVIQEYINRLEAWNKC